MVNIHQMIYGETFNTLVRVGLINDRLELEEVLSTADILQLSLNRGTCSNTCRLTTAHTEVIDHSSWTAHMSIANAHASCNHCINIIPTSDRTIKMLPNFIHIKIGKNFQKTISKNYPSLTVFYLLLSCP